MNNKELLYYAANLKLEITKREEEYEMLKPQLKEAVAELSAGAEKPEVTVGDLGKFCQVKGKTKWTYSPPTEALGKELKEIQKSEQANGKALAEQGIEIKFFANKGDSNGKTK
jgi:hypothetical protein